MPSKTQRKPERPVFRIIAGQLAWFAQHVDRLFIFDNSDITPVLAASKHPSGRVRWLTTASPELREEMLSAGLERDDVPLLWLSLNKDPQ